MNPSTPQEAIAALRTVILQMPAIRGRALPYVGDDPKLLWIVAAAGCLMTIEELSRKSNVGLVEMYSDTLKFAVVGALLEHGIDAEQFFATLPKLLAEIHAATTRSKATRTN